MEFFLGVDLASRGEKMGRHGYFVRALDGVSSGHDEEASTGSSFAEEVQIPLPLLGDVLESLAGSDEIEDGDLR
jgi:hypothetical protein